LFIKCPGCHNMLRLPRGKGKLQVTCPKCGERFNKKT
jgi:LSD1 subclass zinc finger protein